MLRTQLEMPFGGSLQLILRILPHRHSIFQFIYNLNEYLLLTLLDLLLLVCAIWE